ncbi:S9 family peptidase, partial [Pseudomonas sp. CCI1.2]|nr:S9 family peptidase [Pseudomonas sp. CCI1.2]
EYFPDHGQIDGAWSWLIRSNQSGINFALYQAAEKASGAPSLYYFIILIAHRYTVMFYGFWLNSYGISLCLMVGFINII